MGTGSRGFPGAFVHENPGYKIPVAKFGFRGKILVGAGEYSAPSKVVVMNIPVTFFAPAERMPIEVVREQARALAKLPLAAAFPQNGRNVYFVLNAQRQIVLASKNVSQLLVEKRWVKFRACGRAKRWNAFMPMTARAVAERLERVRIVAPCEQS